MHVYTCNNNENKNKNLRSFRATLEEITLRVCFSFTNRQGTCLSVLAKKGNTFKSTQMTEKLLLLLLNKQVAGKAAP